MARPIRNFTGVQNESLRTFKVRGVAFDDIFNEIHDALEEAYYGDRGEDGRFVRGTGWRDGVSKPFTLPGGKTFDVQPTAEESKTLFNRLHGLLWERYAAAMHRVNMARPAGQQLPREAYDALKRDERGDVTVWKSDRAQTSLDAEKTDPVKPIDFGDPTL